MAQKEEKRKQIFKKKKHKRRNIAEKINTSYIRFHYIMELFTKLDVFLSLFLV